jgi:hypothetical protein
VGLEPLRRRPVQHSRAPLPFAPWWSRCMSRSAVACSRPAVVAYEAPRSSRTRTRSDVVDEWSSRPSIHHG